MLIRTMFSRISRLAAVSALSTFAVACAPTAESDLAQSQTSELTTRSQCVATPPSPSLGWAQDRTPFLLAAETLKIDDVRALLDGGADPNQTNSDGRTALNLLAWTFGEPGPWMDVRLALIQLLLARGANIDHADKAGNSALMSAAWMGGTPVVDALVAAGADTKLKSKTGATALSYAVEKRSLAIVQKLLDAGAPTSSYETVGGDTPLHVAARNSYGVEIAKLLLDRGASPNHANCKGDTPLTLAAQIWFPDLIEALLVHGADPNAKNDAGQTPVGNAVDLAFNNDARTNPEILAHLLKSPQLVLDPQSEAAQGALVVLSGLGRLDLVKGLLDRGVPGLSMYKGMSPALSWARGGYVSTPDDTTIIDNVWPMLTMLVAGGADVNAPDGAPLQRVAAADDLTRLNILLTKGANPNAHVAGERSALFYALRAKRNQNSLVNSLMDHGADPNVTLSNGVTVLHNTFLSPFIGGETPQSASYGFLRVLEHTSDGVLWAKVNGTNAVELAMDSWGPAGSIVSEMAGRLQGKPSICLCSAKMPSRVRTTGATCAAARGALDAQLQHYPGANFADPICWQEPAPPN